MIFLFNNILPLYVAIYLHACPIGVNLITEVVEVSLNKEIGARLRIIRGERTQEEFVSELDMLSGMTRSHYSMIEIGKRAPSLKLLDMISNTEFISYDYLFGISDYPIDSYDSKFQQLIEIWYYIDEKEKKQLLNYANKIGRKKAKNGN